MNLKFDRTQELLLIALGLESMLNRLKPKTKRKYSKNKGTTGKKWSKEQRRKYAETMARKFGKDKK